jgi:hypothetical protein
MAFFGDVTNRGKTISDLIINLRAVFQRFREYGIRLRLEKCVFLAESVKSLGYIIDENGLRTIPDKVAAIKNAPKPKNKTEFKSFLGLVNYYGNFIKNLATVCTLLYKLCEKNVSWAWEKNKKMHSKY